LISRNDEDKAQHKQQQ